MNTNGEAQESCQEQVIKWQIMIDKMEEFNTEIRSRPSPPH